MKKIVAGFLCIILVVTMAACNKAGGSGSESSAPAATTVEVTDREGNQVVIPVEPKRIISTIPSNTEVLVALGAADRICGVDKYSKGIEGLSTELPYMDFSSPNGEAIIQMEPDLIIASGHNKRGGEDPFAVLEDAGIPVLYLPSSFSIDGIYEDIRFLAQVVGEKEAGESLIKTMQSDIATIVDSAGKLEAAPKVYFEIGPSPNLYSLGKNTFLNEMIELAGGKNIFAEQDSWISVSEEAIIEANPDIIFTNVDYVDNAVDAIKARAGWENITAVAKGQVYLIESNSSSRPSHHIMKALKDMATHIHAVGNEKA